MTGAAPQDPPVRQTPRRRAWVLAGAGVALAAFLFALWQVLLRQAEQSIRTALGPEARAARIGLAWNGVDIEDLSYAAPAGWPGRHPLRVARIRVVPEWLSLLSQDIRVARVEVTGADVTIWRTGQGRWRAVPAFTEPRRVAGAGPEAGHAPRRRIHIGELVITGSSVAMIDSLVSQPPHRVALRGVNAIVRDVALGDAAAPLAIQATARLGAAGQLRLSGRLTPGTLDSQLEFGAQRVALASVEPYLLKAAEAGVRRGEFDLQLRSTIAQRLLDAPGRVVVRDLELKAGGGVTTFMGLPREALVERLKDHEGRIDIPFHLAGRLDDPSFSVGAAFKAKLALAAADVLGLQQWLGALANKSGVGAQVERAAEKLRQWLGR
ncbi:MAG: DUF748 domain-containing protein [Betaproteobacteria bacterium]|nr:DUF748 domain-containing protein [Betaproteobacteria bacterium]